MTKEQNDKGFLVLRMDQDDCRMAGFGLMCDQCMEDMTPDSKFYYIAVLNMLFCEECYRDWYEQADRYEEDIPYEERRYRAVLDSMGLTENDV